MPMQTLHDLYVEELQDLYSAEQQILRAIPKMIKGVQAPQLQNAFNEHLEQTKRQVERLDRIFEQLGTRPGGKQCKGMQGVIADGDEILQEDGNPTVKDAGILSAAQHVEHYEMAGYGSVRTYAQMLGYDDAARALQLTLNEEGETDQKLTKLAESLINARAEENFGMQMERDQQTSGMGSRSSGRGSRSGSRGSSSRSSGSRSRSRSSSSRSSRSGSRSSGSRSGSRSASTRRTGTRTANARTGSRSGSRSRSTQSRSRSRTGSSSGRNQPRSGARRSRSR